MRKIDAGQVITILANVGVIACIFTQLHSEGSEGSSRYLIR
jgi:hypothetical protein